MINTSKAIDHIVSWLQDYCQSAGMEGFVVGVSGGIDSAVTSTLCAKSGLKLTVLNMPIHQAADQETRADRHIDWLRTQYEQVTGVRIDLTPVFESLTKTLPPNIQDDLTMANTRSRLRMVTLYSFAGHSRLLVAGTGNKVEDFGVGFYTKYGDGGVDIAPIADLMKSEVYALGEILGISSEILQAEPTDGLWADNRTDESQIGASYEELEWAMRYLDNTANPTEPEDPRQREVLAIYNRFHQANRHKMDPIPVCQIPARLKS